MKNLSICLISFITIMFCSLNAFCWGIYFLMSEWSLLIEWEIISLNSVSIVMTILLDWMSLLFMSFVLFIASLVIFYSKEYMSEDININRFIILVVLFVISMMFLIISPNLISILLGWDGLGLVSYCLVIYFQNVKSFNAGMITALSNRIGDVALLLAISWMLNWGGWNYIFYLELMKFSVEAEVVGGLVVLAAMTKSAQIPFSSWLPAAMAAPTPVSALVHSSTLVTAGVYLLIRFNYLLEGIWLGNGLLPISGLTMFMAGMGANFEFDLKKIIALSTLSQLGLMMSILSLGFLKLAFFHLLTHALFKALLFMCAGSIIHNMGNSQDIRFMGGLSSHMPLTICCFCISSLALCGFPFLAGFYSKDLILETVSFGFSSMVMYFLFFFSTGLTVCYSFRLIYYITNGELNCGSGNVLNDEGWVMLKSMSGLMMASILGGSILNWLIFPSPEMIFLPQSLKLVTLITCFLGGMFGYIFSFSSVFSLNSAFTFYFSSFFSGGMWFMPMISTLGMVKIWFNMGKKIFKNMDHGWSEEFGGVKLFDSLIINSQKIQMLQNNYFKVYLMIFMLFMIFLIII